MKYLVLAIALAACGSQATSTTANSTTPAATKALDLTVRARAERAGQKFGVAANDKLKTGDYLELFVTMNEPAYLYVVQFFADGSSAVLYPDAGDKLVQPGTEVRIPEAADDTFQLDDRTGEENIYVLATREPVARADASIAGAITKIRVSGDAPATDPAKPDPVDPPKHDPDPPKHDPDPPKHDPDPPKHDPDPARHDPVVEPRPTKPAGVRIGAKAAVQEDRFHTLASRGVKKVKRPDGAPAMTAAAGKREDAMLVLRFSFQHE